MDSSGTEDHNTSGSTFSSRSSSISQYVAPTSAPAEKSGYLEKQSKWVKKWRVRFVALVGKRIYYSMTPNAKPHGWIELTIESTVRAIEEDSSNLLWCFAVETPSQTLKFSAQNEVTKAEWMDAIQRAISEEGSGSSGGMRVIGMTENAA
jgi:hypothetical protein